VKDNILDFENLLEQVLNGSFHMVLPMSFKKIEVNKPNPTKGDIDGKETLGGSEIKEPKTRQKQKSEDGNSNLVRNMAQDEDFVCKSGETWKETYSKQLPHDRPFFDEANKVNMCARWLIKGDCYDNCSHKASHVSKDDLPADKKASFLDFMKKCRKAGKKGN
jgi:hypothetical protein